MKFAELSVSGAWLIEAEPFVDSRGLFRRHFCRDEYARHGLDPTIAQGNVSENPKRGTLRGIHFQRPPWTESKTLSCMSGAIYDVVVDLRPTSPTYLKWVGLELTAAARTSLYVPAGCGNAWLTLQDNTSVHYYMASSFEPGREGGIRFDDPTFSFSWPFEPAVISDKDLGYPQFDPSAYARDLRA
ncbi:MAG: dTDP-4-keto-6-deoxy-D-glucose epimerase [Alphaproteobacteria bacterium]|nr:dTDP-4-keto-6-deoxy-D-glucose epimerase [Alphaproteobacteria bacterium]